MRTIQTESEWDELHKTAGNKVVVVDFTAVWCGPCQKIAPLFESLAAEYSGSIFVKVDVDANEEVAAACKVSAMPTFQFFREGKMIDSMKGADTDGLKQKVASLCANGAVHEQVTGSATKAMPEADAPKERPNATPTALVLAVHAVFLAACGVYGAASNDWAPKAMHSVWAGLGSGGLLVACAIMAVLPSRKMYMIGVHVALLLQVLFTAVFCWQAYRSYGVPAKADRFPLFVVMGSGSAAALFAMRAFKPSKKKLV